MKLTPDQQKLLDGGCGKGKAMAMRIQAAVGEAFGAQDMVPITRAHVALSAQEADTWFAGKLLDAGASCAVSPTVNPGYSMGYFTGKALVNEESAALMRQTEEVYRRLGAALTYSCTPYLAENIPQYSEYVSFSETSATVYVNSVLGARTHRESSASALCAAVTGFVPRYGMLLEENRRGTVLVEVKARLESTMDLALLGLAAPLIGSGVPVFAGLPPALSAEALIALGTQLNVAGSCDLYHIVGVTPDAPDLYTAFCGAKPERTVEITEDVLAHVRETWCAPTEEQPLEFVILGCPHYTWRQVQEVFALLNGRRAETPIWVLTSAVVLSRARESGLAAELAVLNCTLLADTCVDQAACWGHLRGAAGATDSPKCAYYMRSFGVKPAVRELQTCISWAREGRSHK